jgi:hypothetical protein
VLAKEKAPFYPGRDSPVFRTGRIPSLLHGVGAVKTPAGWPCFEFDPRFTDQTGTCSAPTSTRRCGGRSGSSPGDFPWRSVSEEIVAQGPGRYLARGTLALKGVAFGLKLGRAE